MNTSKHSFDLNFLAEEILLELLDSDFCNYYYIPHYAPKVIFVDDLSSLGYFNLTIINNKPIVLIEINDSLSYEETKKTLTHELLHYILYLNDALWRDNEEDFIYWANILDVL